jgi:predicted RNA binding protein YcfA (HicA-like mRNA interferase family)
MPSGYARRVREILRAHGCTLVRQGKGDHELCQSPLSQARFVVDGKIVSRHLANAVLKQAGIKQKID